VGPQARLLKEPVMFGDDAPVDAPLSECERFRGTLFGETGTFKDSRYSGSRTKGLSGRLSAS